MLKTKIYYPRGSGGNWLSNLIWHLEKDDYTLPQVDIVFDGQSSASIPFSHIFEVPDPSRSNELSRYSAADRNILFSTDRLFNLYLNDAIKVRYRPELTIKNTSLLSQYFTLSDSAWYILNNEIFRTSYCCNIDLDYRLVFQNPDLFVDSLFDVLDSIGLKYTPNKKYALHSIEYYRSTCPDPATHIGNLDSIIWLGWCHALTLINKIPLAGTATEESTMENLKLLLEPVADQCLKLTTETMYFLWQNE